jgi:hypothetical protein
MLHDQVGHPGRKRTIATIRRNYNWIGMGEDIGQHVRNCRFCKLRKPDNFRAKIPIQEYSRMSRPFDRVHADLAGPFNAPKDENVYILLIKDAMTKFLILIPLKNKTAEEVTNAFSKIVLPNYGPPKVLITDRGTDFVNKQLKRWCIALGTDKKSTTPANPRADGLAENAVRTVKDMIVAFINTHQTNWDKYLPIIQYNYNTTVNDATGHDPYFLMFGRSANVQGELAESEKMEGDINDYASNFAETMNWIWKYNSERVVNNSYVMKAKQHPRTFLEFKEYSVGDYFYSRRIPKRFYKDDEEQMLHKIKAKLQEALGKNFIVETRYEQNKNLYAVMQMEKWVIYGILSLILIVAAFNMIGALTMLVLEKQKDIAVLKAMGSSASLIQKIFITEGLVLAGVGTIVGTVLGTLICLLQLKFKIITLGGGGSFIIDYYPVKLMITDYVLVVATITLIAIMAAWIPAKKASQQLLSLKS